MEKYHPVIVTIHWLLALMIIVALTLGGPALAEMANDNPEKIFALKGHMIWGSAIGVLMLVRLVTRLITKKPPHADSGVAILNSGAKMAHWGLYVLVLAMVGSGIATAISADLISILFLNSGAPMAEDFSVFTARVAHGAIGTFLLIFIGLHILGWAYHQFILRDGLISRMWFGKRS